MSPSCVLHEGTVFVALKCYFDGSKAEGLSLTLGAVAGDEQVWSKLQSDWVALLTREGAAYMHMREAMSREDEFYGWLEEKRNYLVDALLTLVRIHQKESDGRLRMFTASVDMVAYDEISARRWLPSPARMCIRGIYPKIYEWYMGFPEPILDVIELYFDRSEEFMQHLDEDWKSDEYRKRHPQWDLIRTIAPVVMKTTPPMQVADMVAWSRNRVEKKTFDQFFALASLIIHSADNWSFDRAKLETYPLYAIM
jgi:hypothetical protein